MTLEDVLQELLQTLGSEGDSILTWEQMREWPDSAIDVFQKAGWIKAAASATMIECPGCEENCFMPVHPFPARNGQSPQVYVACDQRDDMGKIRIPLVRLQQWQITTKQLFKFIRDAMPNWEFDDDAIHDVIPAIYRGTGITLAEDHLQIDVDQLRQIISSNRKQPSSVDEYQFLRMGATWSITYRYTTRTVNDTKGMNYLHYLISHPHQSIHVTTLQRALNPVEIAEEKEFSNMHTEQLESQGMHIGDLGDAGELLDKKSKSIIESKIRQLREEIEEAEEFGDVEKRKQLEDEIDVCLKYLTAGTSIEGKKRKAGSAIDRQRVAVKNAIKRAIDSIKKAQHLKCSNHLRNFIHTGVECKYTPNEEINWKS